MVELNSVSLVHDENAVRVDDSGEPVCNQNNSATFKARSQLLLDQVVRLQVDIGRGLVKYQDPRLLEDSARQTNQLLLTD